MRRPSVALATALVALGALAILLVAAPRARAEFGFSEFDTIFTDSVGKTVTQAGSHPYQLKVSLHFNSTPSGEGGEFSDEAAKDIIVSQMKGFVGNPTAVPRCATADFLNPVLVAGNNVPDCPDAAALGLTSVTLSSKKGQAPLYGALYNLVPPPGVAAKLGFWIGSVPVTIELGVKETPPYNVTGGPTNISQVLEVIAADLTIWGNPALEGHDPLRGHCLNPTSGATQGKCPANIAAVPFLTMPRSCAGPQKTTYAIDSWLHPGAFKEGFVETHDAFGNPEGMSGCGKLGFEPEISAVPTSKAATSPSGLDFSLDTENQGLANPEGISNADIEKAVVTLPVGFSTNPAVAEGLAVCSEAQLKAESPFSAPGEGPTFTPPGTGCPEAAKIGSVEVETPILEDKVLKGSLYIAKPYENPFNSLIALYMVIKDPGLGVVIKVPFKVSPDPLTGQLVTVGEDLPPFPLSHFKLHFREGGRSPLITPPGCGSFEVKAKLYPSSGGAPVDAGSSFELSSGPNGTPCPTGPAPFHPGFEAGANNNAAGHYSPFYMRLTRADGEQDMTKFSAVLPPGVIGKIAGIPFCPEAGIAQARSRTGAHGGSQELADPSCPAASKIGRTLAGAGVGSQLAYVPGSLYLAGPYAGDPLSVVAITPAVAGPFDAGAVVVREALTLNPVTGEVEVDGRASDPIPHILQGIPLNVRDLRVFADRQNFTFNATSCEEEKTKATLIGGGTLLAPRPDTPAALSSRYQAADCAALGFKPKLQIELKGGTKRGGHPALKATVTPRPGDANFAKATVTLPHSAFLDQAHIRTICTRVQFAAGAGNGSQCPAGSVYGKAKAWTPVLDEPATGPVFLRSSDHNLPDLVVALEGPPSARAHVEIAARIDSVKGGIRSTFSSIPDFPVSKFVLEMQGANKGLIVNSRNLCAKPGRNKATSEIVGQNGRRYDTRPLVRANCGGKRKGKRRHEQARAARRGTAGNERGAAS